MKYILNKYHLNVPDSELLDDLKKTAKKCGAKSISFVDYHARGKFSSSMLADRFGSWNMALNKAGLKIIKHYQITEDALRLLLLWNT